MMQHLPAILIGGPPHAGKSVLTYNLTQALRQRKIAHYVLRANPDGEGDFIQEMNQNILDLVRIKGKWTPEFVTRMCVDLERRQVPLLVDVGGRPRDEQMCIFQLCTDAILLLHAPEEEATQQWLELVRKNNLHLLAQVYSKRTGDPTLTAREPVIEGILVGLERGCTEIPAPLFGVLVERVAALFRPHTDAGLEQTHLSIAPVAPTEYIVNLDTLVHAWAPESGRWEPSMMQRLLQETPTDAPLALYGRGTNWVYGALAVWSKMQPFHQFDIRLGWTTPPSLNFGNVQVPVARVYRCDYHDKTTATTTTVLTVRLPHDYIEYAEAGQVSCPPIPAEHGLILSGKLPYWLVAAILRLYHQAGVQWIACYQPPVGAVVISSQTTAHSIGDILPKFWGEPEYDITS